MIGRLIAQITSNIGSLALYSVLCASLALNLFLGNRLRTPPPGKRAGMEVGVTLATIPVVTSSGIDSEVRVADGRKTFLYILSPSCGWCRRNHGNILALSTQYGSSVRFVGISTSTDKLEEYLKSSILPFPVYAVKAKAKVPHFDISLTPQLVLIGPTGKVEKVWVGALDSKAQLEVETAFGVKLPGTSI